MKRRSTTVMGLAALVVMLVLGVFSAGAAQASRFLWTGALPGLLLVLAQGPQSFIWIPGGSSLVCKHARLHGKVEKESQLTQRFVGLYTGCEEFGFAVTFSPVEYEVSAEGKESIVSKTLVLEIPLAGCKIKVAPNGNQNLGKVRYLADPNSGGTRLSTHFEVDKIDSVIEGGGGLCGPEGLHTEGSYRGLILEFVHGSGAYGWVP